jgi:capsid protein
VLEQLYQTFRQRQDTLEMQFYNPVLTWKIDQWIKAGELPNTPDVYLHEWMKPAWPWIDQLKEVEANKAKLELGITTVSGICKSLNIDPEMMRAARVAEIEADIVATKAINEKHGTAIPYGLFSGVTDLLNDAPFTIQPFKKLDDIEDDDKPEEMKPNDE